MKSIDVSAATIEEAINDGLAKLGCSISDCKVQVLQEGAKGLFGLFGSKPATVRLTLLRSEEEEKNDFDDFSINLRDTMDAAPEAASRNNAPKKKAAAPERRTAPAPRPAEKQPAPEAVQQPEAPKPSPAPERQKNSDVLERFKNAPLPGTAAKPAEPAQTSMYVFRPAHARQHEKARPARREEPRTAEALPRKAAPEPENIVLHDPQTLEGMVQQFLLELTQKMGLSIRVDVRYDAEENHLFANIYGDALGILIGRRGETLDALQYLTSLHVNKGREGYTRVTLDTENYRAKREEALMRLANRMANRAGENRTQGCARTDEPLRRRILHSSLQNNQLYVYLFEGEEPYRHVVIVPAK